MYIAPIKALCSEREEDWKAKFGPLGYRVQMWTGDVATDEDNTLVRFNLVWTVSHGIPEGYPQDPAYEYVCACRYWMLIGAYKPIL